MPAVSLRRAETAVDRVLHRYGAVRCPGRVRRPQLPEDGAAHRRLHRDRPVAPERHYAVRVQQFARRARVPVDISIRTAIDARQSGRRMYFGVLRLFADVRCLESVSVHMRGT